MSKASRERQRQRDEALGRGRPLAACQGHNSSRRAARTMVKVYPNAKPGQYIRQGDSEYRIEKDGSLKKVPFGHFERLLKAREFIREGFGGVLPGGSVVDRRENALAIPLPEDPERGIPAPKELAVVEQKAEG